MKPVRSNQPQEILPWVRDWVRLLSEGKFVEAEEWIYYPPGNPYGKDPELTKENIAQYSPRYRGARRAEKERYRPRVTSPYAMDPAGEQVNFWPREKDRDERGIDSVEYYLPLDGKWSVMRVKFRLIPVGPEGYGLLLRDISVP